ncbi:MAG TPA: hypothetical protein PLD12_11650, partial [Bacteroidales bacterium]|nr:hypothetical protein [Bacteroidales bacterium]
QSVGRRKALNGKATAIPYNTGHNKHHGQRFGLPCLPYSVLTRAGGDHLCLIFFATFLYQDKKVGERKYLQRRRKIAV